MYYTPFIQSLQSGIQLFLLRLFSLNDYLNELDPEELSPSNLQLPSSSQDENNIQLPNFAQAALLLQNSSCVYSRKVEYLHSLVYQTLHSLIEQTTLSKHKKNSNTAIKGGRKRIDEDIFNFEEFDSDLQFLLLDDVLPVDEVGTKINMKQISRSEKGLTLLPDRNDLGRSGGESAENNSSVLNTTRLSIGLVIDDQLDNGGSSGAADAAGNSMNATLRLMNGTCQINSATGALLMPGTTTEVPTIDSIFLRQKTNDEYDSNNPTGNGIIPMDFSMENDGVDENGNENDDGVAFDDNFDNDDDEDDAGNGFVLHDDEGEDYEKKQVETYNYKKKIESSEALDPWKQMLDPHDNSNSKVRPMKFGKTIRLPKDCDEMPSEYVSGAGSKRSRKQMNGNNSRKDTEDSHEWWNECIAMHTYNAMISHIKDDSNNDEDSLDYVMSCKLNPMPLIGHLFGNEFQYIAKEQRALKAAQRRKEIDKKRRTIVESAQAETTNERFRDMYEDDNESFVDFNGGGADFDDDDGDMGGHFDDEHNGQNQETQYRDFDNVFTNYKTNGDSTNNQVSFEELCRLHLQEFMKDAANYTVETGLTKRVGDWQSKLATILEEEDSRPEFNITVYSNKIIGTLDQRIKKNNKSLDGKMVRIQCLHFISL